MLPLRRWHASIIAASLLTMAQAASAAGADEGSERPTTIELSAAVYRVTVLNLLNDEVRTLSPALSETLSYAPNRSIAIASGFTVFGRDLTIGSLALRWFPRGDATDIIARHGSVETGSSTHVKFYAASQLEFGRVRSTYYVSDGTESDATFEGLGAAVGGRMDVSGLFGVGMEAQASLWIDAPASTLALKSTTTSVKGLFYIHL